MGKSVTGAKTRRKFTIVQFCRTLLVTLPDYDRIPGIQRVTGDVRCDNGTFFLSFDITVVFCYSVDCEHSGANDAVSCGGSKFNQHGVWPL